MVGPVLAEILQGVRTLPEYEKLQGQVGQVPYLEETSDTWNKVGSLSYQLRRQGMALVLVDLLIASLALENDFELYTLDEHFQRIPGLRLHTPNEAD